MTRNVLRHKLCQWGNCGKITSCALKKGIDIVESAIREVCARETRITEEKNYFNESLL